MSRKRNIALSLLATGALLVSVLVLLPEPAHAARIDLASTSISQLYGDDNRLDVTLSLFIPPGEHIPLDSLKLNVIQGSTTLHANGLLGYEGGTSFAPAVLCVAAADSVGTPRIDIDSVRGGTPTTDVHRGYGYSVGTGQGYNMDGEFGGYGYEYTGTPEDVFAGYGTGEGYAGGTSGTTLTIKLTLHGCGDNIVFTNGIADVTFQAYLGTVPGPVLPSLPVNARFYEATGSPVPDVVAPPDVTYTGDGRGASVAFVDGEPGNAPISLTLDPGSGPQTVTLSRTDTPLPQGTRLLVNAAGSGDQNSFGAAPQAVATQRTNILNQGRAIADEPAVVFQFLLDVPGEGSVDPARYFNQIDVDVEVPTTAFNSVGGPAPNRFAVFGFSSEDGGAKPVHPSVVAMGPTGGPTTTFTLRITDFSSFQGYPVSQAVSGGSPYIPPEVTGSTSTTSTSTTSATTTSTTSSTTTTSVTTTSSTTTTPPVPDPDVDIDDEEDPDTEDPVPEVTDTETPAGGIDPESRPNGTPWLWIGIGVAVLAAISAVIILIVVRRK